MKPSLASLTIIITFLTAPFFSYSSTQSPTKVLTNFTECKKNKNLRILGIYKIPKNEKTPKTDYNYRLFYTREGVSAVVGKCKWKESCDKISLKIQNNLKKSHWKCKQVQSKAEMAH